MYGYQKNQIPSSSCRRETLFRHQPIQYRASALTRSTNMIENKLVKVHEVEHQKSLTTEVEKRTKRLSEVISQLLFHSLPEN